MFVIKERREGRNMGLTAGKVIWLPRFHEMGWTIKPLGLPELISREWSVAVMFPIDAKVLASARAARHRRIGAGRTVPPGAARHCSLRERQAMPRQLKTPLAEPPSDTRLAHVVEHIVSTTPPSRLFELYYWARAAPSEAVPECRHA
jgi:hypothetical protein